MPRYPHLLHPRFVTDTSPCASLSSLCGILHDSRVQGLNPWKTVHNRRCPHTATLWQKQSVWKRIPRHPWSVGLMLRNRTVASSIPTRKSLLRVFALPVSSYFHYWLNTHFYTMHYGWWTWRQMWSQWGLSVFFSLPSFSELGCSVPGPSSQPVYTCH